MKSQEEKETRDVHDRSDSTSSQTDDYDSDDSDEDNIAVEEISINGVNYYLADDNRVFDPDTCELVGYFRNGKIE